MRSMKRLLLSSILMNFFTQSIPLKAVTGYEQEEDQPAVTSGHPASIIASESLASEEKLSTYISEVSLSFPQELLEVIFIQLNDIRSLGRVAQVSKQWKAIVDHDNVWRPFITSLPGLSIFRDPNDETSLDKAKVQRHFLRVIVNAEDNLARVQDLVTKYNLSSFFGERLNDILKKDACPSLLEALTAQGNEEAN